MLKTLKEQFEMVNDKMHLPTKLGWLVIKIPEIRNFKFPFLTTNEETNYQITKFTISLRHYKLGWNLRR